MGLVIETEGLTKLYGRLKALDNVSLRIPEGASALLGPNGAGKSTLVKGLLGLLKVQGGTGRFFGHDIRREKKQIRQLTGYVPEDDCYIVGLTGLEAVKLMGELGGLPPRESLRRSHEILDLVGILEERYREVQTYSTGMKQKVKLAQALIHDPKFLILDEPTNGLDPEMRMKVLSLIKTLVTKKGVNVLICTHLIPDVEQLCNYAVIIGHGNVLVQDYLSALQKPAKESYFVRFHGEGRLFSGAIKELGLTVDEERHDLFQVFGDGTVPGRVLALANGCGVQVREIYPCKTSLEEIFMKAVSGEK